MGYCCGIMYHLNYNEWSMGLPFSASSVRSANSITGLSKFGKWVSQIPFCLLVHLSRTLEKFAMSMVYLGFVWLVESLGLKLTTLGGRFAFCFFTFVTIWQGYIRFCRDWEFNDYISTYMTCFLVYYSNERSLCPTRSYASLKYCSLCIAFSIVLRETSMLDLVYLNWIVQEYVI